MMNPFEPGAVEYNEWQRQEGATPDAASADAAHSTATVQARPVTTLLSDVKPERVAWLWPRYLARGKVHVIDGDPGLGKSTLTLDLAGRLTTGSPWPDGQPGAAPAGVVILSAEDGLADTIRPRLDAAGADPARVVALTAVTTADVDSDGKPMPGERLPVLPGDLRHVRAAARQVGAGLVIVDPFMAYLDGAVNSHRDQDVRRAMAPLARLAEELDVAVVLVRHLNKSGSLSALYRGGGSIGILGAARLAFTVARDPSDDTRVVVACSKANITAMPPALAYRLVPDEEHGCARLEWDAGPVPYTAVQLLAGAAETPEDREDRTEAERWLIGHLADHDGEQEAGQVIREALKAGIAVRTVQRARQRSPLVTMRRTGYPARTVWSLDVGARGATEAPDMPQAPETPWVSDPGASGSGARGATPPIDRGASGAQGVSVAPQVDPMAPQPLWADRLYDGEA